MSLFISCEETNALLSDYEDGALPWWQAFKVRLHLLFCPDCRAILATLRILPALLAEVKEDAGDAAEKALEGALARITQHGDLRPWPSTPVPPEARELLDTQPDLPLSILAATHQTVARARTPEPGPYHLPKEILDQLPPENQWRWAEDANGKRQAELLQDPVHGQKLILAFAPNGARSEAHRHLGSESILVLAGTMMDEGRALGAGDWIHHGMGTVHAPEIRQEDCWCLIREEGGAQAAGPLERRKKRLMNAS